MKKFKLTIPYETLMSASIKGIVQGMKEAFEHMSVERSRLELKVLRTEDAKEFPLLHIKKAGDAGFDIPTVLPYIDGTEIRDCLVIPPCGMAKVPTGVRFEIPAGYWISLHGRSSTGQMLVIVPDSIIDEGYRGEIFGVVINLTNEPIIVNHGDRLIQAIIHERISEHTDIIEVDELTPSERGETGFGSSGK